MKGKGDNYHLVRNELIQASTQHKARVVSLPPLLSACRAAFIATIALCFYGRNNSETVTVTTSTKPCVVIDIGSRTQDTVHGAQPAVAAAAVGLSDVRKIYSTNDVLTNKKQKSDLTF